MSIEMFTNIVQQFVKGKEEVDLFTPRVEGFQDNIIEIPFGLNKYTTLKLNSDRREAHDKRILMQEDSDH